MPDYTVRLDAFEGPLDLLLYLVRKAEVEITDIPIATIADQYIEFIGRASSVDIETAGDFLVTAATLMEIKSRMLTPKSDAGGVERSRDGEDAADPRDELIGQLLEYQKYRAAADELEDRSHDWARRSPAGRSAFDADAIRSLDDDEPDIDLGDVHLMDLVEAFGRIAEAVDFSRLDGHTVVVDDTPIELHAADLMDLVRRSEGGAPFRSLFVGRSRAAAVGMFLALLELCRHQNVRIRRDDDEIFVELGDAGGDLELLTEDAQPSDSTN